MSDVETSMSSPKVSVVIAAFNREDTIVPAMTSVLDQDYRDLELLVVDDGSTDGTVAAAYSVSDPRVSVLLQDGNTGVSAARNRGIAAAKGAWVAFQDSDDLWKPGKLRKQMQVLEGSDQSYVAGYCAMEIEGRDPPEIVPNPAIRGLAGDILPSLVETSFISTQTLIVRKDILQLESGFDPEQLALVDWELMLRVSGRGAVAYIDEPLVIQRFSGNSITRSSRRRADARARLALKHRDLFSRFPGTLARHFHAVSGAYRQVGDFGRALEFNHHARKADPTSWRLRTAAIRLSILKMINRADTK